MNPKEAELLEEISEIIESINDHIDRMRARRRVQELEVNSVMIMTKSLMEKSAVLKYIHLTTPDYSEAEPEPEVETPDETDNFEPETDEPNLVEQDESAAEDDFSEARPPSTSDATDVASPIMSESELVAEEPQVSEVPHPEPVVVAPETDANEKQEADVHQEVEETEPFEEPPATTDPAPQGNLNQLRSDMHSLASEGGERSVNDRLATQKPKADLATKLQHQPIADLTTAFAINERFHYVNDLFGGSLEAFTAAIEELNQLSSAQEARELVVERGIGLTNPTSLASFLEVVDRRYL